MSDAFKAEMLAVSTPRCANYDEAFLAWLRYYTATEAYDRSLPHAMRNGEAIPVDEWAMRESRRYARNAHERMIAPIADRIGKDTMMAAKDAAGRLGYDEQVRVIAALESQPA
jgi:hypothetical protein